MLRDNYRQNMEPEDEMAAVRFALIDLGLYLDTHPDNRDALRLFSEYRDRLATLERRHTSTVGPLTMGDVTGKNGWTWGEGPMPFEGGF
ncbi:MAG: spore coat protein CotJB [Clostridia bacterium]|nr:spore coat protein CotJB [Clostridia bacterium]